MTYRLRGRRLLCRPIETDDQMPGGRIWLTGKSRDALTDCQAEIVAVGTGGLDPETGEIEPVDPDLRAGAWIIHAELARRSAWIPGYWLIDPEDVVAVLTCD